jgi:hypothetical protein
MATTIGNIKTGYTEQIGPSSGTTTLHNNLDPKNDI